MVLSPGGFRCDRHLVSDVGVGGIKGADEGRHGGHSIVWSWMPIDQAGCFAFGIRSEIDRRPIHDIREARITGLVDRHTIDGKFSVLGSAPTVKTS